MAENVRIALWIPADLRDELKKRGNVSDEIRRRVDRTLREDSLDPRPSDAERELAADPHTRELIEAIVRLAALVEIDSGFAWHADNRSHTGFMAALRKTLADYKPDKKIGPIRSLFGGDEAYEEGADKLGESLAELDQRQRPEKYEHLRALRERRSRSKMAALAKNMKARRRKDDKA